MSNLEISRAQRLDQKVIELLPDLSRGFATKLIDQGKVTVNGAAVLKAGYKLRAGDEIQVEYDAEDQPAIPDIDLPILYEDKDCVVIDKPLGLLTHSKGAFNPEATVATWLRSHINSGVHEVTPVKDSPANKYTTGDRAGIVHRLDRATSGVMICAKNPAALAWLQKQFSQRKVKKSYQAIVSGHPAQDHAVIDMPIERNPKKPQTFRVGINGKSAVTEYEVVATGNTVTELVLKPLTGRTHQLRVHLANIGHPIVGDTLYGGAVAERLFLHAKSLEITLPSRERMTFEASLPKIFREYMKNDDAT